MILFIDSNIFISAYLTPSGTPAQALNLAAILDFQQVTGQYNLREMWNVFERKFPSKVLNFQLFMQKFIDNGLKIFNAPEVELVLESQIRDAKDRPVLRAAVLAGADIFLTGDRDFLDAGIDKPKILTAAEFLEMFSA